MSVKLLLKVAISVVLGAFMGFAVAQDWKDYGKYTEPIDIINDIVEPDETQEVIDTQLNQVDKTFGPFQQEYKIAKTADSIRYNLDGYLQWIAFFSLAAAVTLLIYNGLRLTLSPLSEGEAAKVRKRIFYILVGAILVTGFYLLLKVVLNVILDIAV